MAYDGVDNINPIDALAAIEAEMNFFENSSSGHTYTTFNVSQLQMCYHQRQLMPKSKTRPKVRKSQRVQTLREYVAVESLILSMPMATKFDQRKKIKKLVKNKRNQNNNLAKNFL